MMNHFGKSTERGIALLIVLFCLLLLSVVGLGMMYSTNMETAINTNFRDKQTSLYAAMAGLHEARDRIAPSVQHISAPTLMPGWVTTANAGSAGIIYIVANSSVDPTDPTNTYFDTELCQENMTSSLGLAQGTAGIPCTAAPTPSSGNTWYRTITNTDTSSAPWNLSNALDMKWVRIQLKANNTTPVSVNGSSSTSTQVCWDGSNQILLPSGYGSSCAPNGGVTAITITDVGSGYEATPTVTLSAPPSGGTQATATASIITGAVEYVSITTGGSGYTVAPAVSFVGGGGTGAEAYAEIGSGGTGAPVQSLTLTSAGTQCYSTAPSVTISGGGGSGATATATLESTASCVYSWSLPSINCGNPWKGNTTSAITLSGGTGFSGTVTMHSSGNSVTAISIQDPGNNYTSGTGLTASGGSPTALSGACQTSFAPSVSVGYRVASLNLTAGGSAYTSPPTVTIGTGVGTTATAPTATATLGASSAIGVGVTSVVITNGGTGYSAAPVVFFNATTGSGAAAVAILGTSGSIQSITITSQGSGYVTNPTVTISPPTGGGGPGGPITASATASIGRGTNYGKVYLLTSLAQTVTGARTMAQMEVASPVLGYATTGALTLAGPNPTIGFFPSSENFMINGSDYNSCMETAEDDHPAISGYDDPNADPPTTSVETIISELPRPENYTGYGDSPSVQNGYGSFGETMGTPSGLKALLDAIKSVASDGQPNHYLYGDDPSSIQLGTSSDPVTVYVDGDLDINGLSGYGILVVTGKLSMGGNFSWAGPVLVVGDGEVDFNGGGNGVGGNVITGTLIVARIFDHGPYSGGLTSDMHDHTLQASGNLLSSLGSPYFNWGGGGGNGVRYDHCWADNLMNGIPFTPPASTRPLKVLSFRLLPY